MIQRKIINKIDQIPYANDLNNEGDIILVDKPIQWSSFDVVKKIRIHFGVKKVGHAGSLDPMASGLLIVCTGKKTKCIHEYVDLEKEYIGVLVLGAKTESYDTETEIVPMIDIPKITAYDIKNVFEKFTGVLLQKPPIYSAVKYKGKPLYKYARAGEKPVIPERKVIVKKLEIVNINFPDITFRIVCSKGTYIRSLVNDIGLTLGCGAYLKLLRRVRIGEFLIEDAYTIAQLTGKIS